MIYDGRSVACLKLIIGNARVVLQVVQDTLSLALQIPEKPGWPATSRFLWFLMLMSLLLLLWQGPRHKPALDRTKTRRGDSNPSAPVFVFCFFLRNKSLLCCDIFIPTVKFVATESKKEWGAGSDISNSIVFECSASPGITNHTVYYGLVDVLNYSNNLMVPPLPCPQNCFMVVRKLCFRHRLGCWVICSLKPALCTEVVDF